VRELNLCKIFAVSLKLCIELRSIICWKTCQLFQIMENTEDSFPLLAVVLSWLWRAFIALLVIGNLKNIPFFWHVSIPKIKTEARKQHQAHKLQLRVLKGYRQLLRSNRPKQAPRPSQLFQPLIMASHSPLMELDYNFHSTCPICFRSLN